MLNLANRPQIVEARLYGRAGTRVVRGQLRRMPPLSTGLGAIDWNGLFSQGFNFGNRFLQSWEARGVARAGQNPYFNPYQSVGPVPQLTPEQLARLAAQQNGVPPGSQVAGGLSQAWQDLANMFGVSSGTLSLLALGGGALLFMPSPGSRSRR